MKILGRSSLSSKLKTVVDVLWYLSLVISALVVVVAIIALLHPFDGDRVRIGISDIGFKMEPSAVPLHSAEGLTAYVSKGVGELSIDGALGASTVATVVVAILVLAGLYLFMTWQLRRLLRTFVEGTPFAQANVRRLRAIAGSLLALVLVSAIFNSVIAITLGQQFHAEGIQLVARNDMSLSTLFSALLLFILAEIFRIGAGLEEEKSLTV